MTTYAVNGEPVESLAKALDTAAQIHRDTGVFVAVEIDEGPRRSNADRMTPEQLQDKWDRLGGLHMP